MDFCDGYKVKKSAPQRYIFESRKTVTFQKVHGHGNPQQRLAVEFRVIPAWEIGFEINKTSRLPSKKESDPWGGIVCNSTVISRNIYVLQVQQFSDIFSNKRCNFFETVS